MIPSLDKILRTVSDGCAPFLNHFIANSSSTLTDAGLVVGFYVPITSIERPSRGARESAATIR